MGYTEGIVYNSGNLADLALDQNDWDRGEKLAREALPLAEELGCQELIGANCLCLARALARQGKAVEGLPYAKRAVHIYTRLGSPGLTHALETLRECGG